MENQKKFNVTGTCIPNSHYMIPPDRKIGQIMQMVEKGEYFTINRPRQYGKTTTLFFLFEALQKREEYLPIWISFEGFGDQQFQDEKAFLKSFFEVLEESLEFQEELDITTLFESTATITSFFQLGRWLTKLIRTTNQEVVLLIDEVDQAGNYPIFFQFLAFLRTRYLTRQAKRTKTFHSVILAGVHDVKNLKAKIRPDQEHQYNSPWNIATDFEVEMSFSAQEIALMLSSYVEEKLFEKQPVKMDIEVIAKELYFFTSGYPFLVSLLCKTVDEKLMTQPEWTVNLIRDAVKIVLDRFNTNFESLTKNLENNPDLYQVLYGLLLNGNSYAFDLGNPTINLGVLYGMFRNEQGRVKVHNRIYEEKIYNYLTSKLETSHFPDEQRHRSDQFIDPAGRLDLKAILLKFQEFMKEQYSKHEAKFLEREGRLIFLAYLRPILNGKGFTFKESQISEEKRLDVVITFQNQQFVVELKRWKGQKAHQEGIKQLTDYLEKQNLDQGYLLIFDFNKKERPTNQQTLTVDQKKLFLVWV